MKRFDDALKWIEPLRAQYATKLTLAGLITYYLANWLRLEEPGWGVATCIVLVMAKHVGAIGEKAILRTLGNLAGGLLGVLLIGNFAENGFILVGGFFIITAYCSWRYGGTAQPYAFLLAAITLNRVVVPNFDTPMDAWETALNRVLEITLGIVVSTVIYSVAWPRYARVEFLGEVRASFKDLAESLRGHPDDSAYGHVLKQGSSRIGKLRKLLDSGARESAYFRIHFAVYSELTNKINALYIFAGSVMTESQTSAAHQALAGYVHQLNQLAGDRMEAIEVGDLERSKQLRLEFRQTLNEFRHALQGRLITPSEELTHFAGLYLTLKHLHSQLRQTGELFRFLETDPGSTRRYPFVKTSQTSGLPTDPFWIRNAIKSTTAGCLAWFLCNWLQPPGATFIPYLVWYFTLMSRQFQENKGDRGVFQFAFWVTVFGLIYLGLALLTTPLLASYGVMNVVLGTMLFLFGYFTATYAGWSRVSRMGFFFILSWLGLDAQSPVGFQSILTSYLQVVLGLWFAAFVDRLWWPILPQWEVCSRLEKFFRHGANYIRNPASSERHRWLQQMGLLSNEAAGWTRQLEAPEFPVGEAERWEHVLFAIRLATYRLRLLMFLGRRNRAVLTEAERPAALFHLELRRYYEAWHHVFQHRGRDAKPSLAPLLRAHATLTELKPNISSPTQALLSTGLIAITNNLIVALKRYDEEIDLIPLTEYRSDRRL